MNVLQFILRPSRRYQRTSHTDSSLAKDPKLHKTIIIQELYAHTDYVMRCASMFCLKTLFMNKFPSIGNGITLVQLHVKHIVWTRAYRTRVQRAPLYDTLTEEMKY